MNTQEQSLGQSPQAQQQDITSPPNAAQAEKKDSQCIGSEQQANVVPAAARGALTLEIMKNCKRWLLWRTEPRENSKPTKVPYYSNGSRRSGKLDTASDMQLLATYQDCERILKNGEYSGLGFALGLDDGGGHWQGIDLDDIPQNGLSELANNAVGYVEKSPSGNGAHAIGYGRHFNTLGANSSGVEAYSQKRFFTYTGDTIRDSPLICIADYVEQNVAPIHRFGVRHLHTEENGSPVQVDPKVVTELRSALFHMSADDYHLWINMGLALVCLGATGCGLWMEWSSTSDKFNSVEASKKWRTFKSSSVSYQTVFYTAQEQGWVNPKSTEAQIQIASPTNTLNIDIEDPEDVDIEYLDDPFLPKGQAIGFFGRGESGKSSLVGTLVARNSNNYSTLWITSEEAENHIKMRHKKLGGVKGSIGVHCSAGFDVYTHLENMIRQAKDKLSKSLGFVVLDSVSALVTWAKGESPNDEASVKRLVGHIDRLAQMEGVSILMIGHMNKNKGHDHIADTVSGSLAWTSSARLSFILQKVPEQDFSGFIRTAKTNLGIQFGCFYHTVPVHLMAPNIDGYRPALCGVVFDDERIYGERNLIQAMTDDGDIKADRINQKYKQIESIVGVVMGVLKDGIAKTREEIESDLRTIKPNRRMWLAVDEGLAAKNVQITSGERNRKYYQLCATPPP